MAKSTKIAISGFLLIIGSLTLCIELINDFEKLKTFYASIYLRESFEKDCLVYSLEYPLNDCTTGDCLYYYTGNLAKNKNKITVTGWRSLIGQLGCDDIPVWYCTYSKSVLIRTKNEMYHSFSFKMINYWLGSIMLILLLPNLLFFIYLKLKK